MKILLTVSNMSKYTGSALSTYEMARVLSRDHAVTVVTAEDGWSDNEIKKNLIKLGVKCSDKWEDEYDLIIGSHYIPNVKGYKINIVRGITKWEVPVKGADFWIGIRPDILNHIRKEYHIPEDKSTLVYNGVDRTRFKPIVKSKRDHVKMVAPCNVDSIRIDWLKMIVSILSKDRQLYIYGEKTEYVLPKSKWVHYHKPQFYMEEVIADADVVVGIYLGRVNLEARSCGVDSIIYDPEEPFMALAFDESVVSDEDFELLHNIENVVKRLLNIYEDRK